MKRAAFALSALGSPFVVLPIFWLLTVARVAENAREFWFWSALCIGLTTGVPALYVLSRVRSGQLTDVHVRLREQRGGPFKVALLAAAVLLVLLVVTGAPRVLVLLCLAKLITGSVFAAISRWWKISMHTGVLASCLTAMIVWQGWPPLCLWLVAPLVWARAQRGRHRISQGVAGWMLGFVLTLLILEPFRWLGWLK